MRRLVLVLFLPAVAALGQPGPVNQVSVQKPSALAAALTGLPYSGELRTETTVVRPDGTRVTETLALRAVYRDSQGRTRREDVIPPDGKMPLRIVTIDDPVDNVEYVLEPRKKIAHRFQVEPSKPEQAPTSPEKTSPEKTSPEKTAACGSGTITETLIAEVIEGRRAEGVRRAADCTSGTTVTDTWTAADLQVVLREHTSNPPSETTTRMTNLRTEEPLANLFQVPADYRIQDETGDFVIEYPRRGRHTAPELISRVTATYTDDARRAGIQGVVLLSATVDQSGKARDIQIQRSLDPGLDQEAVKAVRLWRFRPGEEDGHAVRVDVHVEVAFSLNQ